MTTKTKKTTKTTTTKQKTLKVKTGVKAGLSMCSISTTPCA